MQALVVTPGVDGSAAVAEMPVPRPGRRRAARPPARGRRLRHRPRDRRGPLRHRARRRGAADPRPRAARPGRGGRARLRRRRPRHRDGAPLLRALPRVRRGGARRVRDRRLQRARDHAPARLRRGARGRAGRAPDRGARGAARRRRARRAGLDLRARRAARARRRQAPAVGAGRAPWSSAPARSAMLCTYLLRLEGLDVWTSALEPAGQREGAARRGLRRALPAVGRRRPARDGPDGFDIVIVAAASADLSLNVLRLLRRGGVALLLGVDARDRDVTVPGPGDRAGHDPRQPRDPRQRERERDRLARGDGGRSRPPAGAGRARSSAASGCAWSSTTSSGPSPSAASRPRSRSDQSDAVRIAARSSASGSRGATASSRCWRSAPSTSAGTSSSP